MASSSVHERLRHVQLMVECAAREPHPAGRSRREALQELISLSHSGYPALKSYAAGHIHIFFADFPQLEEEAINAVYDLCEDHDPEVRVQGYRAVTQVSAVQHKWVKRNADVLVQLLQSDEPEEVKVVKDALLQHLNMDPPVTLGVLCDQIVPPEEDLDDDERQARERSRSLVLSFLATDAMSAVQKYTDPPGSEAEHVLVTQLLLAITRLDTDDVDMIVKNVLLRLPCFRDSPDSSTADRLLQSVLDKVAILLQTRSNDPVQLKAVLHYLSLAQTATVDLHATPAVKLLQFYISSLTRKLVLQRFLPEDRIQIITWIMDTLSVSERQTPTQTQQAAQPRRQLVDASSIFLEVLYDSKLYQDNLWRAVKNILYTIKARKELENWILPSYLITSIGKFLQVLPQGQTQEDVDEFQNLIRWLIGEKSSPPQAPLQEVKSVSKNEVMSGRPAHLPKRPSVTGLPPLSTQLDLPMTWSTEPLQQSPVLANPSRHFHVSSVATSPKQSGGSSEDIPRTKRVRMNPRSQDAPAPSLLSRLADAGDTNSSGYSDRAGKKRKKRPGREQESPEPDRHPSNGYSIKGAANARRRGSRTESLLDRMRPDDMDMDM